MDKFIKQNKDSFYGVFRILVGLLFFIHGSQKLFGWFGGMNGEGSTVELMSLFGAAGVIEFVVGILLVVGMYVSYAALIGAIEMIIAYVYWHIIVKSGGLWPWTNGGEPVLLFLASFFAILAGGTGKWKLQK